MDSGIAANKQAKSVTISEAVNRLRRKLEILEELISELQGAPSSITKTLEKISAVRSFVEVYDSLNPTLEEFTERLEKITQQLREILI